MSEQDPGCQIDAIAQENDLETRFKMLDASRSLPVQAMAVEILEKGRDIDMVIADRMWEAEQVAHEFGFPITRMRAVCVAGVYHYLEVARGIEA